MVLFQFKKIKKFALIKICPLTMGAKEGKINRSQYFPVCIRSLSFPGIPVNYNDVASIDPEYAKNLQVRTKTQDVLLINHVLLVTCNHFLLVSHVLLVNHILLVNHVLLINRVLIIG